MSNRFPPVSPEYLLNGKPTGLFRESIKLTDATADVAAALTTQVMTAVAVPVQKGDVISNITFLSGATAAGTPTNYFFALYDDSATPALIQQSADQLTAPWAADTAIKLALAAAYEVKSPTVLYAVCMVKATTVPSLICKVAPRAAVNGAVTAGQKIRAQTSGSALTATAPATLATPTTVVNIPYALLS